MAKYTTDHIKPTMTDKDVLEFCKTGFIILKGVVDDSVNKKVFDYLEDHSGFAPSEILQEDYFVSEVLMNKETTGIVRSLLGESFALPVMIANHRSVGVKKVVGGWHQDAGAQVYPPACNY